MQVRSMTAEQLIAATKTACARMSAAWSTLSEADKATAMLAAVSRRNAMLASNAPGASTAAALMTTTLADLELFFAMFDC